MQLPNKKGVIDQEFYNNPVPHLRANNIITLARTLHPPASTGTSLFKNASLFAACSHWIAFTLLTLLSHFNEKRG
ncbi:hypothetical protein CEXT_119611 [Caerostris extrusa]|uniref:Uncharacterized protein n=1 Tax=Caerostris extrusa TaxID=172846 RepID=A0AAV4VGT9_CAEEX|nr:hypothetical protein CEXT_119611 [Caerostris extrusa]